MKEFKFEVRLSPAVKISADGSDSQKERRYDIQHNDIQHNDIQHNDIQHNDIQPNDIQHNSI